jgi:hypothetical protein
MPPFIRLAGITAATAALTLLAAPAFAGPQMIAATDATVPAPVATLALKITPVHLTLRHYQTTGLVAHASGFPASTTVDAGYGWGQAGDSIGSFTTSPDGTADIHFRPSKDHALAGPYTFGVNYTVPAIAASPVSNTMTTSTTRSATGDAVTTTRSTFTNEGESASDPGSVTRSVTVSYTVKASDAKVAWGTAHRSGTSVALKSTVTRWSPSAKKYVPWHDATVKFQERIAGVWKTKATVTTNAKGVAARTVSAKVHTWRALVLSTKSIWGTATQTHKK